MIVSRDHSELGDLLDRLETERSVYEGALNLLQVIEQEGELPPSLIAQTGGRDAFKRQVGEELQSAEQRIADLQERIDTLQVRLGHSDVQDEQTDSSHHLRFDEADVEDEEETRHIAVELLQDLSEQPPNEAVGTLGTISNIMQRMGDRGGIPVELAFSCLLPFISDASTVALRAATYRTLRHFMTTEDAVDELRRQHLDIYLIKTLSRDAQHDVEKQQAVRTIRHLLQFPGRVSPGVMKAVVAVAENGEDKLRLVCLELLAELVICDIELLTKADGLRVVLQALADGPYELAPTLASLFLYLVDVPKRRDHLRPGTDLEMALNGLSEVPSGKGHYFAEKTKASIQIVTMLLKSWSGLLYLCSENKMAIKSLVQCLYLPSETVCENILDTLFHVFRLKTDHWQNEYISGKRGATAGGNRSGHLGRQTLFKDISDPAERQKERATLVDQYLGMILMVFIDVNLLEALGHVAENLRQTYLSKRAALLVGELLSLASRVLPIEIVSDLQALPRLFALAAAFEDSLPRLAGTTALQSIDDFSRALAPGRANDGSVQSLGEFRKRSSSLGDPLQSGQRAVDATRVKVGLAIDDTAFRNLLVDTQVLTASKDEQKWNLDALVELFAGPLLNPARFDEVNKGSKLLRRLTAFFHPFEHRFANLTRKPANMRWVHLLKTIVDTLLVHAEGVRFLMNDKLLAQVGDAFLWLNANTSSAASEPFFSRKRFESTMSYAYVELVGKLTHSVEGMNLLQHFHVVSGLYSVADLRNREDLIRMLLETMSYIRPGHPRILLSKALTCGSKDLRIFSTRLLGDMLQSAEVQSTYWMLELLVAQLYDPIPAICRLAIALLDDACNSAGMLETVVEMRPSLEHLGDDGAPLLFRFLGSSVGVRYLHAIGYVDAEMEEWYDQRNRNYVIQLELQLARSFRIGSPRQGVPQLASTPANYIGAVPPHFYGELAKTPEGHQILREAGHLAKFAAFIRKHGLEDEKPALILTLKSVIWAVGHIGASSEGICLLEEEDTVRDLVQIAQASQCYSVRGTTFYSLGLIANSTRGIELLEEQGWLSSRTPLGVPLGICVPKKLESFLSVSSRRIVEASSQVPVLPRPSTHAEREAVAAMASLTNHLLTHKSSKTLARLRSRQSELFASPDMLCRALHLLETLHYRLPARRFIFDLFTIPLEPENLDRVAAIRDAMGAARPELESDSLSPMTEKLSWLSRNADFSDEDDEPGQIETVARQELPPQSIIRGFSAPPLHIAVH